MEGSVTPCPTLLCALCFTILLRPKSYEHGVFQVQSSSIKWTYFLIIMAAKRTRVPVTLVNQTGGYMRDETVKLLLSNLLVLRGHIRDAHIKIQALEDVLNDVGGPHHARYFA